MSVVTWSAVRAAEHFTMLNARLLDRHRFAHLFQNGPTHPVRTTLSAYRNLDGGYGNALHPDLRGHASQPVATLIALDYLDDLGPVPVTLGTAICRYLTTAANPDGGLPPVLPGARHTGSAPWWRHREDFSSDLGITAHLAGLLHKHNISHPWRDNATAYCWSHINTLHWTNPAEAIGVCTFLQHVGDRQRAVRVLNRLRPMIRAVIDLTPKPGSPRRGHIPTDLATHPQHIARPMFTDTEIRHSLDHVESAQRPDGGWDSASQDWDTAATLEHQGMRTIDNLRLLHAYGRVGAYLPPPRQDS